jgi:hypothetical protein
MVAQAAVVLVAVTKQAAVWVKFKKAQQAPQIVVAVVVALVERVRQIQHWVALAAVELF